MAISYIASSQAIVTGTSVAPAVPTGTVAGDVMIATVNVDAAVTISPPTGWTAATPNTSGSHQTARLFWKVATSGETATTFSHPGASVAMSAVVSTYRGVDNTTPMDSAGVASSNASSLNVPAPSITTVTADAWVVWAGCYDSGTFAVTAPPSTNSRHQVASGYRSTIADYIMATPGATGIKTGTASTARTSIGSQVALRPDTGGTPPATPYTTYATIVG
jgi:hypothetical protein